MTYTKYARRIDTNHTQVVKKLRELGATVFDASRMGQGFPDLVIGINGKTVLVEIKSGEEKKFTEAQLKFMENWKGSTVVRINDLESAERLIKLLETS